MFKVRILTVLALSMLALFAFSGAALSREPQPGDDRGGHGAGVKVVAQEPQPGDDRGGHGAGVKVVAREPQPGDDRGGHGADDRSKLVG